MGWEGLSRHKSIGGMGFRDFRDFNLALLGKQGWRFITRPESLVSRVYKARYFPKVQFLESSKGNNSSYIWRSVWEAKAVLSAGLRWMVGSGKNIKIIGQPWLGEELNPYITTDPMYLGNHTVSTLFHNESREWDGDLVKDMFGARDQLCILNTKIGEEGMEDHLYWCKESSGVYSVRSAYRLLQFQKGLWHDQATDSLWRKVWQVKAPAKVLNFIWRALSNCLPTKSQLVTKFVPIQNVCPFCNNEEETVVHILVKCPVAQQF